VTFGGEVGGTTPLTGVVIDSAADVIFRADVNADAQDYRNASRGLPDGDITLDARSGPGDIDFRGTTVTDVDTAKLVNANNSSLTLLTLPPAAIRLLDVGLGGSLTAEGGAFEALEIAVGNDVSITANTVDLLEDVSGNGLLTLQPFDAATSIGLGDGAAGTFALDSGEIGGLLNGFSSITIGRADGQHQIEITGATFRDPVFIRAGTGSLAVNGPISGEDNASIELIATGPTGVVALNSNIVTEGNSIDIFAPISLGADVLLDTTVGGAAGADINLWGGADGAHALTLAGGSGDVLFASDVGLREAPLTSVTIESANDMIICCDVIAGAQDYTGANRILIAFDDPILDARTGPGNIDFSGTDIEPFVPPSPLPPGFPIEEQSLTLLAQPGESITLQNATVPRGLTVQSGFFTAGNLVVGDDISLTADTINLNGTVQSTGGGNLNLQPSDPGTPIALGDLPSGEEGFAGFHLDSGELGRLQDGFGLITIGRADGQHPITVGPDGSTTTFQDPILIQTPGGGSTTIAGVLQGTGDASVTLTGSGGTTFLNNDIITFGRPITINDAVVLGADVLLDTTDDGAAGANISLNGRVDGAQPLRLAAGIGDILFGGDVGGFTPLASASIFSATNVTALQRFIASGAVSVNHTGQFNTPLDPSLNVGSLFVNPGALGAQLFGVVSGAGGRLAALAVDGPVGDPDFTINGCVIGIPCVVGPEIELPLGQATNPPPTGGPIGLGDLVVFGVALAEGVSIVDEPFVIAAPSEVDPLDPNFRQPNFGNTELWAAETVEQIAPAAGTDCVPGAEDDVKCEPAAEGGNN
jgi:hypothetical protein